MRTLSKFWLVFGGKTSKESVGLGLFMISMIFMAHPEERDLGNLVGMIRLQYHQGIFHLLAPTSIACGSLLACRDFSEERENF
jgi:hypothetical protein